MAGILKTIICLKNKTTAEWANDNSVQAKGSPCIEFTADGKTKLKIGDGVNTFAALPYVADELTQQTILDVLGFTPADSANIGIAGGIAPLDDSGKIASNYLPSYVDDVIEYNSENPRPETGEAGKIYIDTDTGREYRWTGTTYAELFKGDTVTASEKNGYIKVNGTDLKVADIPEGITVDSELNAESLNPVQNKVITAALNSKVDVNDVLILNCNYETE